MSKIATQLDLKSFVRDIPDFPKPGIVFKDITPLLKNPQAFSQAIAQMSEPWQGQPIDHVIGIESRGFMFGAPMAVRLGAGFIPIRKPHKLPAEAFEVEYDLEYGKDKLGVHKDAVRPGERVLIVDDVLATGGTMQACVELARKLGADVAGIAFLIELSFLNGRQKIQGQKIHRLIEY